MVFPKFMTGVLPLCLISPFRRWRSPVGVCLLLACAGPAAAETSADLRDETADRPDGVHVLDGSYVLDMGQFHVNITNHGLIGSQYTSTFPFSRAPSGEWPGGSGHEYLWGAGLWIGRPPTRRLEPAPARDA